MTGNVVVPVLSKEENHVPSGKLVPRNL